MNYTAVNVQLWNNTGQVFSPEFGKTYQCHTNSTDNATTYSLSGWKVSNQLNIINIIISIKYPFQILKIFYYQDFVCLRSQHTRIFAVQDESEVVLYKRE